MGYDLIALPFWEYDHTLASEEKKNFLASIIYEHFNSSDEQKALQASQTLVIQKLLLKQKYKNKNTKKETFQLGGYVFVFQTEQFRFLIIYFLIKFFNNFTTEGVVISDLLK